ncbi:peptidoglycan DD-metalloendopeptidase family protein [Limnohabitans sp. 63ED37-2]|uniref:peptidoglycan DD-metalloendopeptidase family protein n=1 Tax=Limnohabitans sp. 63ED37-2 TaxID=1678128 RepID=UPI000706EC30|nr:peptidoglycan DD-metalloendopeptidase family protein [Limnohabitans sp. 63ED37-2]ALK88833.1 Murein hydrolase activator NlpD precursor [Limnohabitans sp. 63ED37-2]
MMFREVSRFWLASLALMVVAGCTSSPRAPAPVETRGSSPKVSAPAAVPAAEAVKVMPGAENAGKPGYYTVQRGDTLTRIALDHGQTWRDLVSWNSLANANLIEVGQVLRVAPPGASVEAGGVVVQPIGGTAPVATPTKPAPAPPTAPVAHDEGLGFAWPASGSVIAGFDEAKNKGLDIAGNAGDPVLAAADGQVVYAGAGLRGYGNLIILKHNNTFLTAYAHNQALLVKEDQKVRKGQKIAEMGKTDADRVKLHFEIRRQGKPVDPAKYLSAR